MLILVGRARRFRNAEPEDGAGDDVSIAQNPQASTACGGRQFRKKEEIKTIKLYMWHSQ
jgi:predicted Fe-Mo cluster-binding NifX family protein